MIAGVILICLALSFFFSGMETGVLLLNRARLGHLRKHGSRGAAILLNFLNHPGHLSSTVLVGNTLVSSIATVLIAEHFLRVGGMPAALGAALLFALFSWFFGDLIPKAIFRRFPNRLATRLAPLLLLAYVAFWPVIQLFVILSRAVIRLMGGSVSPRQMFVTREELKLMAYEEGEHGVSLTGEQRNLVSSILDSQKATAKDVMSPLPNVVTVGHRQTKPEQQAVAVSSGFSRFPVQMESRGAGEWEGLWVVYDDLFGVDEGLRHPPCLEAGMRLEEILPVLRKAKSPFGFVKDHQGRTVGIVTVEDVLRRYLGKIDL